MRTVAILLIFAFAVAWVAKAETKVRENDSGATTQNLHSVFSLQAPPDWVPESARDSLVKQLLNAEAGRILTCKNTGAVVEAFQKGAGRFLVVPMQWESLQLVEMTDAEMENESAPPIQTIRDLLNSHQITFGQLFIEIRTKPPKSGMGGNKSSRTENTNPAQKPTNKP